MPLPGLTEEARERLEALSTPALWVPGEYVFHEGEPARRCWLLRRGRVLLSTAVPGRGEVVIETLAGGDVLGWSWLRPPRVWSFGARAADPTEAREIDIAVLHEAAERDPVFGYEVSQAMSGLLLDRLQATRARLLDLYGNPEAP
ncbi:cyclic nucleotide-binding domain-containing protein [Rhodococcus spongiicola]|uniref:Cyclic nucleotide-binding domain-containing protein n=1 Tax=Rhodococcus spongiicola TaxID=2487352 RepID=A0A3S3CQH8_9NOCA|nr:cyclic nucleotide-binding domain-containing protein [Rhodococcus spongiicola]